MADDNFHLDKSWEQTIIVTELIIFTLEILSNWKLVWGRYKVTKYEMLTKFLLKTWKPGWTIDINVSV